MSSADEANREPRTRTGMARRSQYNTSFPMKRRGERYSIQFVQHGRVTLDVHKRIPISEFGDLAKSVASAPRHVREIELSPSLVRALLIDAEVALFHYAADRMAGGQSDTSHKVANLTERLADLLEEAAMLGESDADTFDLFAHRASPELSKILSEDNSLVTEKLRACLDPRKPGRIKNGEKALNIMLDGFLDDWTRRTERPVRYAKSPGSAYHFYLHAVEKMNAYPPAASGCPVRSTAAELLPDLRKSFHEPWLKTVRNAAD